MSKRLSRLTLILVTAAGLAASTGTASATPSDNALEQPRPTTRPAARHERRRHTARPAPARAARSAK